MIDATLRLLRVVEGCRRDLVLAVGEACANAVVHADGCLEYRVAVVVSQGRCAVEVIDSGLGPHGHIDALANTPMPVGSVRSATPSP